MKQILLILILTITCISCYNKLEIPYQAHSMNDLNLTLQELIKGVKNFKFDVSQATRESCEQQSTWGRDYSQCGFYGDFGMETCCLALRGDCSQQPVFNYNFNTSDDMIAMISNPKYAFLFNKNTTFQKYQGTKYFAFNFQYSARNAGFTTDFIYNFLHTIEELNLDLKMVTGTTGLIQYYDNKCIKLKTCNEKEEYISQSNIILQSDYQGPRKRDIQYNQESTVLDKQCKIGFPKYSKDNDIPIQLWEPSYQDSVYDIFDTFWSKKCFKFGLKNPQQRFKITSNVNSENYSVFLQKANQTLPIQYVPPKYHFENTSHSLIETNNDIKLTFISRLNNISNYYELHIYENGQFDQTGKGIIFGYEIIKLSSKGEYLLIESIDKVYVYSILSKNDIKQIYSYNKSQGYSLYDLIIVNNQPHLIINQLQDHIINLTLVNVINNSNVFNDVQQVISNVNVNGFKSVSAVYFNGEIIQIYSYEQINHSNNISEISFLYLSLNLQTQNIEFYQPNSPQVFGTNSILKIEQYNGKLYFIQVNGNGSCWSGVFINNGDWCKCTLYKQDKFHNLRNIPYTITYLYGRVDDLLDRIKSSSFINSCDKRIISSKVYNGNNPQIAIVRDNNNKPTAYIVQDYVHYNSLPLLTTLFLGSSSYDPQYANKDNLKMTELISFDLLEYEIFDIDF